MAKTMINNRRCPRCNSALFLSEDPLDGPGTSYCLAGHTFYSRWAEVARATKPILRGAKTAA